MNDDPVEVIIGKVAQDCKSIGANKVYAILLILQGALSERNETELLDWCGLFAEYRLEELKERNNG